MNPTPSDLVTRMLHGDHTAFEDVITWYAEEVLRLSYWLLRDRQEAEDVLQESLLSLARLVKAGKLRKSNGSIKGFLLRCARNLCIDRLRKKPAFSSIDEEDAVSESQLQVNDLPSRAVETSRFYAELEKSLDKLSDRQRTIFILYELNGESYQEIAETLRVSIEYVRKNLYRARRKLETDLAPFRGVL